MTTKRPLINAEVKKLALKIGWMFAYKYPDSELTYSSLSQIITEYHTNCYDIGHEIDAKTQYELLNLADRIQYILRYVDTTNSTLTHRWHSRMYSRTAIEYHSFSRYEFDIEKQHEPLVLDGMEALTYYANKQSRLSSIYVITRTDYSEYMRIQSIRPTYKTMSRETFSRHCANIFKPLIENSVMSLILYREIFQEYDETYFNWFEKVFERTLLQYNLHNVSCINPLSFLVEKPFKELENNVMVELDDIIEILYSNMYSPSKSDWFKEVCGIDLNSLDFNFSFDSVYNNRNFSPESKIVRIAFKPQRPDKASLNVIRKYCRIDENAIHHYYVKLKNTLEQYTREVYSKLRDTQYILANKLSVSSSSVTTQEYIYYLFELTGYINENAMYTIPIALKDMLEKYIAKYNSLRENGEVLNKRSKNDEKTALFNLKSIESAKFYK